MGNASSIGNPVRKKKWIKAIVEKDGIGDETIHNELAAAAAQAELTGMFTCHHTCVALAVVTKLDEEGVIKSSDKTVVISTAHGLKFTDFKVGYHESTLEDVTSQYANPAVHLPASVDAVKAEIEKRLTH